MCKVISGIEITKNEFIILFIDKFNKWVNISLFEDHKNGYSPLSNLQSFFETTVNCTKLTADHYINIDKYILLNDQYSEIYKWISNPILYTIDTFS